MHFCAGEYKRAARSGTAAAASPTPALGGDFPQALLSGCSRLRSPSQSRGVRTRPPSWPPFPGRLPAGCATLRYLLPVPGLGCAQAAEGQQDPPRAAGLSAGHGAPAPQATVRSAGRRSLLFPASAARATPAAPLPGSAPRCLWPPPPPRPRPRAAPSWPRCPLGSGPGSLSAAPRLLLTACTGGGGRAPHLRLSAPGRGRPPPGPRCAARPEPGPGGLSALSSHPLHPLCSPDNRA